MSYEALAYGQLSVSGRRPKHRRLIRMPAASQWLATMELAIAEAEGRSYWSSHDVQATQERYYYITEGEREIDLPDRPGGGREATVRLHGWWMLPERLYRRAMAILEAARTSAGRWRHFGDLRPSYDEELRRLLHLLYRWRDTGAWRRHAQWILPRHGDAPPRKRGRVAKREQRLAKLRARHPLPGWQTGPRRLREAVIEHARRTREAMQEGSDRPPLPPELLDLRGVDLRGADIRGVDLRGADMRGAWLQGATMRHTRLPVGVLHG